MAQNGVTLPVNMADGSAQDGVTNGVRRGDGSPAKKPRTALNTDFLSAMFDVMVKEALQEGLDVNSKVVEFKHPKDLESSMDLDIGQAGTPDQTLISMTKQIVKYSVKSGHPHFFNQLYGGFDPYTLAGAWLTESLNTSQYTYEVAPVFTLMEKTVLAKMCRLAGFQDGDAIFCPGGSVSNMYAINLARYKKYPSVKTAGMGGLPPLCIMTSETGHYSMKKGASFLGLGMDNVIAVKCDDKGRMLSSALEDAILKAKGNGMDPVMVNATAGTTVLGAYDPLVDIADVCEKYGIWMHVDGAWGAGVLLSGSLRHLMTGIERADSLTWNPHKMMGAALQTSAFLTRHKNLLSECHSAKAKYLFQQDKFYDVSYDTGDKSVQCGRKVDVLKLWMMWKAKGDNQFERDIDNIFACSRYLTKKLQSTEGFRLVLEEPECTNICFWYIPPSMRNKPEDRDWWEALAKMAPRIKQRMTEEGTLLIGYQPDGHRVNFFRMVVSNTSSTLYDMDFVVSEIDRLGRDL
ncbi:cysteine sulfinic acid decarboxylase-like isoform X1 [Haliotis cracherodii]|uniref:cysteine sulfinic acid decarboxylase-like isoform X1 n=2 Tax=Haliotis cracherodii TaxID=6455 RepID=UPI0039EA3900